MPYDHQQWGICDHHQAWHHHRTAQKRVESAVCSADGIKGHCLCLEGGTSGVDSEVFVTKIADEFILGPDILCVYDALVDLKHSVLWLGEEEILLWCPGV
jgi:hypothetical protein